MSEPTCGTCRFYCTDNPGATKGSCRRYPPQVTQGRQQRRPTDHPNWQPRPEHYFPMVIADQWCGEFQDGPQRTCTMRSERMSERTPRFHSFTEPRENVIG